MIALTFDGPLIGRKLAAVFADQSSAGHFRDRAVLGRRRSGGPYVEKTNRLNNEQAGKNNRQRPSRQKIEICLPPFHAEKDANRRFKGQTEKHS